MDVPNTIGGIFFCASCLSQICRYCKSLNHEGMSYANYIDATDGTSALAQYKAANQIKDYPRCKAAMQKTFGCNHMRCPCGAHICWVCLDDFDTDKGCYDHLRKEHGGIGIEMPDEEDLFMAMNRHIVHFVDLVHMEDIPNGNEWNFFDGNVG